MVFFFLVSVDPQVQVKLSIHDSNLNSRFISMSELELILLMGVLILNCNTMDPVKILEENKKLHIQLVDSEGDVMQNHEQKK
jgi:hypothetical protein